MKRFVIGMDGGGTKTSVAVADLNRHILLRFKGGAINYNSEAPSSVRENLVHILDEVSADAGGLDDCAGICVAAAGVSNPAAAETIKKGVAARYQGPLSVVGDQAAALFGATGNAFGIVLISGTGSICFGRNRSGKEHRTGGFGHLIDDAGSGYAIGRDILSAVVRSYDGRVGKTQLTQPVFRKLGVSSISELIGFVYAKSTGKREIAALAPLLDDVCRDGDVIAKKIAVQNADALFKLLPPVIRALRFEKLEIALSGSILLKDEFIRARLFRNIARAYPGARCFDRKYDASYGAVLIALDSVRHISEKSDGRPIK